MRFVCAHHSLFVASIHPIHCIPQNLNVLIKCFPASIKISSDSLLAFRPMLAPFSSSIRTEPYNNTIYSFLCFSSVLNFPIMIFHIVHSTANVYEVHVVQTKMQYNNNVSSWYFDVESVKLFRKILLIC